MRSASVYPRNVGPAVERMYQFVLWLIPTVDRFPRNQKFLLGDRIQTAALDVYERLLEASFTKARSRPLQSANLGLEKLRAFFRMSFDFRFIDQRKYEHAARSLDEVGRLVGGWIRQEKNHG